MTDKEPSPALKDTAVLIMSFLTQDRARRPIGEEDRPVPKEYYNELVDNLSTLQERVISNVQQSLDNGAALEALQKLEITQRAINDGWEWEFGDEEDPLEEHLYKELVKLWNTAVKEANLGVVDSVDWARLTEGLDRWPEFGYFDADELSGSDSEDESRHKTLSKQLRDLFLVKHVDVAYPEDELEKRLEKLTNIEQAASLYRSMVRVDSKSAVKVARKGIALDNADNVMWAPKGPDGQPMGSMQSANPFKFQLMKAVQEFDEPQSDLEWVKGLKYAYEAKWALNMFDVRLDVEQHTHVADIIRAAQEATSCGVVTNRDAGHVPTGSMKRREDNL